jgi:hypothetical protein
MQIPVSTAPNGCAIGGLLPSYVDPTTHRDRDRYLGETFFKNTSNVAHKYLEPIAKAVDYLDKPIQVAANIATPLIAIATARNEYLKYAEKEKADRLNREVIAHLGGPRIPRPTEEEFNRLRESFKDVQIPADYNPPTNPIHKKTKKYIKEKSQQYLNYVAKYGAEKAEKKLAAEFRDPKHGETNKIIFSPLKSPEEFTQNLQFNSAIPSAYFQLLSRDVEPKIVNVPTSLFGIKSIPTPTATRTTAIPVARQPSPPRPTSIPLGQQTPTITTTRTVSDILGPTIELTQPSEEAIRQASLPQSVITREVRQVFGRHNIRDPVTGRYRSARRQ